MAKQNENAKGKSSGATKQVTLGRVIMFYLLNFVAFVILWPLVDLIIASISHREFQYSPVSHIATPAIWAVFFTIFDVVWYKHSSKKK